MAATTSKQRLLKLLAWAGLMVIIGLAYALFHAWTGWGIPCPFHAVTGLWCPGCGVTRMCLALLELDLSAAWAANPGLLLLLPVLILLLSGMACAYVRTGSARLTRVQNILIWCMVIYLLVYGVARNLSFFSFLAPKG